MKKLILYCAISLITIYIGHASAAEHAKVITYNTAVVPIFSQRVQFRFPDNWKMNSNNINGESHIIDFIPKSEKGKSYENMFAVIGLENFALLGMNASTIANAVVQAHKDECPKYFIFENLGTVKYGNNEAVKIITACRNYTKSSPKQLKKGQSEIIISILLAGEKDIYIIKRIIRGKSFQHQDMKINRNTADLYLMDFMPLKICALKGDNATCD